VPAGKLCRGLTATALLFAGVVAHADYKASYSRGLEAYKSGNYEDTRRLMKEALDEHPEAAERVRLYGQRWEPYLPQYYLGLAAFKLGDCTTALSQWNSAENQRVVAQLPDTRAELARDSDICKQKQVAQVPAKPPTPVVDNPPSKPSTPATTTPTTSPSKPQPTTPTSKPEPPVAPPRSGVPEPLQQAFDNYLAGKYAEVARINPDTFSDARARYHAYLVRAAARFTLSQIQADEGVLDVARGDVRAARALDAKSPDATMFSTRFRSFYSETR
jgi:hypothetical protein